jgi:hypothetical protein
MVVMVDIHYPSIATAQQNTLYTLLGSMIVVAVS